MKIDLLFPVAIMSPATFIASGILFQCGAPGVAAITISIATCTALALRLLSSKASNPASQRP